MRYIRTLILVAITAIGCAPKNGYKISGTIVNTIIDGKSVYMYSGTEMIDSAKVVDNKFEFTGIADSVIFTEVTYDPQSWKTYGMIALEQGNIELTLNHEMQTTAATGTTLNNAISEYVSRRINIELELKPQYEKIVADKTLSKKQRKKKIAEINKMYFEQSKQVAIQTITENTDNEVGALFLSNHYPSAVTDSQFESIYSKMSDKIKNRPELKKAYKMYKEKNI